MEHVFYLQAEENVSDNTSEAGENTASTFLDKLREISNDGKKTITFSASLYFFYFIG